MKKLLSLPPNLVDGFHDITGYEPHEWYCTSDPLGHRLGSGGGTAWLLASAYAAERKGHEEFATWLSAEKRLLLHAGGQSRRLPSYAPSGKILTPIPVFRWERGQRLSQDLLSLQVPLYQKVMEMAPERLHTMVVSGDVLIRATQPLQPIPDADVVCYGLWLGTETATNHGVFVSSRQHPDQLECMLQKPSAERLGQLSADHYYLTDIGVWLFSDKAIDLLMRRSMKRSVEKTVEGGTADAEAFTSYDMYGEFGCCLGTNPTVDDAEIRQLKVAILPLPGGEFYHFGTSHELLSSSLALQNRVNDQRQIMHHSLKPHPSMFVMNAITKVTLTKENQNLWIENSHIGSQWSLSHENVITGVPENDWHVRLEPEQCVDIVPVGTTDYVVRPYRYYDRFDGQRQQEPLFPVAHNVAEAGLLLRHMLGQEGGEDASTLFDRAEKWSAEQISAKANLRRLVAQRTAFRLQDWPLLAQNHQHSVFYQLDLHDAAHELARHGMAMPDATLDERQPLMKRIHHEMFHAELEKAAGRDGSTHERQAFALLREGLTTGVVEQKQAPRKAVHDDQIVWGRSPVRIDIAGGWTDTPPYCLMEGGQVINMAVELNGQPPLQAYAKPCREPRIVLRSIDLGASEVITTYEQLADFHHVGSPFSIPKASLALAGFLPRFASRQFDTLEEQLNDFGCGIELTMLSAVPAGSGLGTSSILAATVLGVLNDFCTLTWDKNEIGHRTLVLEQLLTTGGGWQDQYGGVLQGIKLLQTEAGFTQSPVVRWLPNQLFTQPEYHACHLLYYTGVTRTAKHILAEIVRKMFLNQHDELALLREMKGHTQAMFEAIQREDFAEMGLLLRKNWQQNQLLDSGTNPEAIRKLTQSIDDLCLGYKLPGAGGGGFLYMVAKDAEAAVRIRQTLGQHPLNANARFVDMTLSDKGLQVSRS